MTQPLVSIIIPCYNSERWVAEAVQSALDQTYPHIEVIVIDDGSTDGSVEVLKSFGDCIYWETGPNRGACAARNRGTELAKGEYLQFLDADDFLLADSVDLLMAKLAEYSCQAAVGLVLRFQSKTKPTVQALGDPDSSQTYSGNQYIIWKNLGRLSAISVNATQSPLAGFGYPAAWLMSSKLAHNAGPWDESLELCQDTEYYERLAASSDGVCFVPRVVAGYRVENPRCISGRQSRASAESMLRCCQKRMALLRNHCKDQEVRVCIARGYYEYLLRYGRTFQDLWNLACQELAILNVRAELVPSTKKQARLARILGAVHAATLTRALRRFSRIAPVL